MARSWSATGGLTFICYEYSRTFATVRLSQYANVLPSADESCTELLYATCHSCVSSVLRIQLRILLLLEAERAFGLHTRRAILGCMQWYFPSFVGYFFVIVQGAATPVVHMGD